MSICQTSRVVSINPKRGKTIRSVEVGALHLQPMALDAAGGRIFISIADHKSVGVFDVKTLCMLTEWKLGPEAHHHQPVAFDPEHHRIFVAFDLATHRLFVPCGDGFLMVIDASDPEHLRVLQKPPTGKDAATGIWLREERKYLLGVPNSGAARGSEIDVFVSK